MRRPRPHRRSLGRRSSSKGRSRRGSCDDTETEREATAAALAVLLPCVPHLCPSPTIPLRPLSRQPHLRLSLRLLRRPLNGPPHPICSLCSACSLSTTVPHPPPQLFETGPVPPPGALLPAEVASAISHPVLALFLCNVLSSLKRFRLGFEFVQRPLFIQSAELEGESNRLVCLLTLLIAPVGSQSTRRRREWSVRPSARSPSGRDAAHARADHD